MRKRRLGNGPLEISELSFGTWLTVAGGIGREQAIRCIHAALDPCKADDSDSFDSDFLARCGLKDRVEQWTRACRTVLGETQ